jgi:DNA excision repair protein ERCC-2
VFTLEDIKDYGREHGICPYFALRRMVSRLSLRPATFLRCAADRLLSDSQMPFVDVIIYSFHYLLDPKVADQVSKELSKDSIVVFDEAHNIGRYSLLQLSVPRMPPLILDVGPSSDNVCIESLSVDLTRPILDAAGKSVTKLGEKIEEMKDTDAQKLQDEYAKLVEGLQGPEEANPEDDMLANPGQS